MTESAESVVADRYGTSRSKRLDRKLGWSLALTAIAVGLVVVIFGNWQQTTTEFKNLGFTLQNTENAAGVYSATTTFEVSANPGDHMSCAVEALNTAKATVGWKVVDLPVIETRSQRVTTTLVTIGPATAAHAKACWPVES